MFTAVTRFARRPKIRRPIGTTPNDGNNMICRIGSHTTQITPSSVELPTRFKLRGRAASLRALASSLFNYVLLPQLFYIGLVSLPLILSSLLWAVVRVGLPLTAVWVSLAVIVLFSTFNVTTCVTPTALSIAAAAWWNGKLVFSQGVNPLNRFANW